MTDLNSTDYYVSRERRERELAQAATDPAIASIHLDMASRYSELITAAAPVAKRA
jgi:hypothetical protein